MLFYVFKEQLKSKRQRQQKTKEQSQYEIQAVLAPGFHLFPFRTEQLSPVAPMVLGESPGEQVAAVFKESPLEIITLAGIFTFIQIQWANVLICQCNNVSMRVGGTFSL